jgi:hypothetical protein
MELTREELDFVNYVCNRYGKRIESVIYNRGGIYQLNLFYKAYRYMYKTSLVKMSKHLFVRVLLRINALKITQETDRIEICIRSDEIRRLARRDRDTFDQMRDEQNRNAALAAREETPDVFLPQRLAEELRRQEALQNMSDENSIPQLS